MTLTPISVAARDAIIGLDELACALARIQRTGLPTQAELAAIVEGIDAIAGDLDDALELAGLDGPAGAPGIAAA